MGRLTKHQWVSRARSVHGNKYDYSNTTYTGGEKAVVVYCPRHGPFTVIANRHLSKRNGCRSCKGADYVKKREEEDQSLQDEMDLVVKNVESTYPAWARKREQEKDRENISRIVRDITNSSKYFSFKSSISKDIARNRKHNRKGNYNHYNKYNSKSKGHIYILVAQGMVKIGVSVCPKKRFKELKKKTPMGFLVFKVIGCGGARDSVMVEREVHRRISHLNAKLSGFDGATEWFKTTPEHAEMVVLDVINSKSSI